MPVIYISHDITDSTLLLSLRGGLIEQGISISNDETDLEARADGTAFHSMAADIKAADVFIIYLTQSYIDKVKDENNRNEKCQNEFLFAIRNKSASLMIPLIIEANVLSSRQWLGLSGLLSKELAVDLTDIEETIMDVSLLRSRLTSVYDKIVYCIELENDSSDDTELEATFKDLDGIFFKEEDGGISMALWRALHNKHMIKLAKLKSGLYRSGYKQQTTGLGFYEGKMEDGIRSGYGIMRYHDDIKIYEGNWVEGHPGGLGKLTYSNNDIYEGEFMYGLPHGAGRYIWSNGDVYEGQFSCGEKEGVGKKTYAESGEVEVGDWKRDVFQKVELPGAWKF